MYFISLPISLAFPLAWELAYSSADFGSSSYKKKIATDAKIGKDLRGFRRMEFQMVN